METEASKLLQKRVSEICDDLLKDGSKVTVRRVLMQLPDVKSTSTVHKYVKNWKDALVANEKSIYDRMGFSTEFTKSFMQEISRFGIEAEKKYVGVATDANEQRDQALEDLEKAENQLEYQEGIQSSLQQQIDELEKENAGLIASYEEKLKSLQLTAEAKLDKAKETNDASERELRMQLDAMQKENKDLMAINEQLRTEKATLMVKMEANDDLALEIKSLNKELTQQNKSLNKEVAELNKSAASYEAELKGNEKLIKTLEGQLQIAQDKQTSLESDNVSLEKSVVEAKNETTSANNRLNEAIEKAALQVEKASQQKAEFEERSKSYKEQSISFEATIDANKKLINSLEKTVVKAEEEIKVLKQKLKEKNK